VALLFAMRLTAAAFGCSFSPFTYLWASADPAVLAWVLGGALIALALLLWLVLRHGQEMVWLAAADGGVLLPAAALSRPATTVATSSHPDVVRAEVDVYGRGGALRARARILARPLADVAAVRDAVEPAVRRAVVRRTGRDLERVDTRVRVLAIRQLARYLP